MTICSLCILTNCYISYSDICKNPSKFITDRSKAVVLLWFSVARFAVRVSVTFHLTCVYIVFGSVSVAEWPPFGK